MEKKRSLEVGLFKKTDELCVLCGAEAAIIIFSPSRRAFVFGHLRPLLCKHCYRSLPPLRDQLSCTSSSEDDTSPTNFSSPFPLSSSLIFFFHCFLRKLGGKILGYFLSYFPLYFFFIIFFISSKLKKIIFHDVFSFSQHFLGTKHRWCLFFWFFAESNLVLEFRLFVFLLFL